MKFKLIVDYGKPYEQEINTDEELEEELLKLKEMAESGEYPNLDVKILNEKGEDITENQFIQEMIGGTEE